MRIELRSHVCDIPQRLREIDPALRVYFNSDTQKFEVWGRDIRGPYLLASFDELDNRAVAAVRRGYFIARNTGEPYRQMLKEQELLDYRAEQARFERLRDIEYGLRDDLKFAGKPVIQGAAI